MREEKTVPTKILFIDSDDASFQMRQCVAKALTGLPPIELYHARDATEALALLERLNPHVVVVDDDEPEERELFLDSLTTDHPPIVVQSEKQENSSKEEEHITHIQKNESLEGIHQTLLIVAAIGAKFTGEDANKVLH